MTLREARCKFSVALAALVVWTSERGYEVAFDEVTERLTEADPTSDHRKGSLHHTGLAADLLLYKDGVYITDTEGYRFMGDKWEETGRLHDLPLAWGGHFKDGNHFSLAWGGHK